MSESKSESKQSKIIAAVHRILTELDQSLDNIESQIREAGLNELMETVNEFREVMEDLRALMLKDVDYFKIRVHVWRGSDGSLKASAAVLGHALEFAVDELDPNTPVHKIIDAVLSNEENIYYAASRAFATLSDFGYKIARVADIREKIENLEREIKSLHRTLNALKEACRE